MKLRLVRRQFCEFASCCNQKRAAARPFANTLVGRERRSSPFYSSVRGTQTFLAEIKEVKVVMAGKARGLPGAYVALFKKIEELGGISTCADALAGYTLAPREVQPIQTYLQENLGRNEALVRQIGCVIGTHAGPGAFGLAFLDEGFTF